MYKKTEDIVLHWVRPRRRCSCYIGQ